MLSTAGPAVAVDAAGHAVDTANRAAVLNALTHRGQVVSRGR
ncbi:hypothetical protein [Streptomyces sp. NPDC051219]